MTGADLRTMIRVCGRFRGAVSGRLNDGYLVRLCQRSRYSSKETAETVIEVLYLADDVAEGLTSVAAPTGLRPLSCQSRLPLTAFRKSANVLATRGFLSLMKTLRLPVPPPCCAFTTTVHRSRLT